MERSVVRGTTPGIGDLLTMVINQLLTGMILQVGFPTLLGKGNNPTLGSPGMILQEGSKSIPSQ